MSILSAFKKTNGQGAAADYTPSTTPATSNPKVLKFVEEAKALFKPESVVWCDGSKAEYQALLKSLVDGGTAMWLNPEKRPNSILVRSDPADVARVEDRTYICSNEQGRRRPDQQLGRPGRDEGDADQALRRIHGRAHHVRHSLQHGPDRLAHRQDRRRDDRRAYVVANMHIMTRVGTKVLEGARQHGRVRTRPALGRHSARRQSTADVPWPCNKTKYICHFPETREIWSYGSGYGGNALLGKKCHALRIASVQARDEGWMAEHMLILKLTNPEGKSKYIAARLPVGVRQDQPRDADADHPRLEGRDHRRRHLLDEVRRRRAALRHQSRDRLLRRRARHLR